MTHWSKFSDAVRDIRAMPVLPKYRPLYAAVATVFERSQRFYLPDGANILADKLIDDEVKKLIRLPFDSVSVLREQMMLDAQSTADAQTWTITVALNVKSAMNDELRLVQGQRPKLDFVFWSITYDTREHVWMMMPFTIGFRLREGPGYEADILVTDPEMQQMIEQQNKERLANGLKGDLIEEYRDDCNNVMNLCALLGTKIARASAVEAPAKLNRRREERGKLPLLTYHVLKVDGEVWDSPYVKGDGSVRSHLRRGHIRRLSPDKWTWVRATLVHGRSPGFVRKDYLVGD